MPRSPSWSDLLFDGRSPGLTAPGIFTRLGAFNPTEGPCDPPESPWGPLHVRRSPPPLAWSSSPRPSLPAPLPSVYSVSLPPPGPPPPRPSPPGAAPPAHALRPLPVQPPVLFHHGAEAGPPVVLASCAWVPGGRTGAAPPPRPISSLGLRVFLGSPLSLGWAWLQFLPFPLSSRPLGAPSPGSLCLVLSVSVPQERRHSLWGA